MKRSLFFLLLVCSLRFLNACGGGSTPPPPTIHFSVTAPAAATAGTAFNFTVTALDASNNTVTTYSGTVHFTSTDAQAALPANSSLTSGSATFSATLKTSGSQTITATDTVKLTITGVSNAIQVCCTAPATTHFSVTAPAAATAGTAFNFTVTALDASNNTVTTYSGTVHFTSTDAQAALPANSSLTSGSATFSATLKTSGSQTITATDTVKLTITGVSNAIQVCCTAPAGTFTPTGSMEFPRVGHTATLLKDGTVLIAGGGNFTGLLATAEIFNPSTGMFTPTKGSMETPRFVHTATLLTDGTVLVTGGSHATGALATAEIFNPSTGMFTPTKGSMETARVGHTATLLNDGTGRVLVAGGGTMPGVVSFPVTDPGTASAELFDPKSGEFTPAGNTMSAKRIYFTATLLPNGEVLMAGGTNTGSALGDLFSPASAMFTATTTGGTTALHLAAALLPDGSVLLTGGELLSSPCGNIEGGFWISIKNALFFSDSDMSFTETGDMSVPRTSHTATLLTGGEVLIAGGALGQAICNLKKSTYDPVATAELFNSESGTFTPTGSMEHPRAGHTATLLGNGKVLLVGGYTGPGIVAGNVLATAELFQ